MVIAEAAALTADPILADAVTLAMLEEQRRIASAAVTAAQTDLLQLIFSMATVLGLFFTLYLTRRSVAQTDQSLKMAEERNRANQQAMQHQNRAYIALDEVSFSNVSAGQRPRAHLRWVNFGNTEARDVRIRTALRYQTSLDAPKADPGRDFGEMTIVPGANIGSKAEAKAILEADALAAMEAKRGCLVVWGEVHYSDVFGQQHMIRFAEAFLGDGPSERHLLEGGNTST